MDKNVFLCAKIISEMTSRLTDITKLLLAATLFFCNQTLSKAQSFQPNNLEQRLVEWLKVPITNSYSCVDDSVHGKLYFPEERTGMDYFYAQLDSMLFGFENSVNVLHIGGSHVQAGDFSGRMRENFTRWGETTIGQRGMIFPFKVLKSNGPWNYYVTYSGEWNISRNVSQAPDAALGLSGAAAIARDAYDTISFDFRDDRRWAFSQIRVIGTPSDSSVNPIIICGTDTLHCSFLEEKTESYIFDLDEEKTTFSLAFEGLKPVVKKPMAKSKKKTKTKAKKEPPVLLDTIPHFTLRGILPISERDGLTYSESGVNGAAVPSWLRCSKFEQDLSLLPPDLVVFGIGINDANVPEKDFLPEEFKENYRTLIKRIRSVSPRCSFIFITNNDCYLSLPRVRKKFNPNTKIIHQAFLDLAKEYSCPVFDVYSIMGGYKSSEKWLKEGLMKKDHIHFTRDGYYLLGDLLYNAIVEDYFVTRNESTH